MGGGSTIGAAGQAAGALGSGAGGAHGAFPAAAGLAGGAARRGRTPRFVAASASTSGFSPSWAASLAERDGGWQRPPHPCFCDEEGYCAMKEEGAAERAAGRGFAERAVFGPVPSREEVVEAVSAMQQMFVPFTFLQDQFSSTMEKDTEDEATITDAMHRVPSTESRSDWVEPASQLYGGNIIQYGTHDRVIDAFRLLQINPSIQRMVFSLSSDEAVWDAVMNNEAVKELRKSICAAENGSSPSSDDGYDVLERLLKWVIERAKAKVMELVNKIAKIVNELLLHHEKDKMGQMDLFEDALRSSFMLSIMVCIVVVVTRFHKALQ